MQLIPDFFSAHQSVALFPESDLARFAVQPAVGDDTVPRGIGAGEHVALRRAGYCGKGRREGLQPVAGGKVAQTRGVLTEQTRRESHNVDDGQGLHGGTIG